eukprot:CAMPEP_0173417406 /NCGR_PEP_ID=MMETSP1356-20130122/85883_1 /TAXON_ID=77927 ORGANISM="Hemiselmis virescens, Strain PCC157" /NCGR_SAMPLE_ID=MMETSP1356 /ASSEMBLY_ACC=CAM_ASM_000847 /LENGTH=225 /DNA_ID=CAMNT_0014379733 /DNA_START=68 /DNA_END=745 /DNA_ORIENTATION=+
MTHGHANSGAAAAAAPGSDMQRETAMRRALVHPEHNKVAMGGRSLRRTLLVVVLACAVVLPAGATSPLKQTSDALASGTHPRVKAAASPTLAPGVVPHHDLSATMAAQYNVAHHKKKLAMKRLSAKATETSQTFQTQAKASSSSSTDSENKNTASILPFLLPPIGLVILATITGLVISIRRWQKIPSLPTQGRLDIKDVQASAARAGGMRTPPGGSKEMAHPWGN